MKTEFIDLTKKDGGIVKTKLTHCLQTTSGKWYEISDFDTSTYTQIVYLGKHDNQDAFACYERGDKVTLWRGIKGSEFI